MQGMNPGQQIDIPTARRTTLVMNGIGHDVIFKFGPSERSGSGPIIGDDPLITPIGIWAWAAR
jgi:hypothetical protein